MKNIYLVITLLTGFIVNAQGLSGEFTVGDLDSDYETFTQMISDLQEEGIGEGGATFTIVPGSYSDALVFEAIDGLSESSPLIITAEPDTVFFNIIGTSSSSDAAISVNSLSYITFENINITDIGTAGNELERGFNFAGSATQGCSFITIRNCSIFLGTSGDRPLSSTRGIRFTSDANSQEATNSNNLIDNVAIDNVGSGIQFLASADFFGRVDFEDENNQIINCTFGSLASLGHDESSGAFAINTLGNKDMIIRNNVIDSIANLNSFPSLPVSTSGISIDSGSGEISQNSINYIEREGTPGSVFGIRVSTISEDSTVISNNKISGLVRSEFVGPISDPSIYLNGIWIFEQDGNVGLARVLHNTIVLDREDPVSYPSAAIQLRSGSTGQPPAEIFNNLLSNSISTTDPIYRSYALVDGNLERGIMEADFNLLVADGDNGFLGSIGRRLGEEEVFTNDLDEFILISETNNNSVNFIPEFVNIQTNDFSIPNDVVNPLDYVVPRIPEIDVDILGNNREVDETYLGAYEGTVFLSISSEQSDIELSVFPNPATNFISLEIPNLSNDASHTLQLFNLTGQLVFEKSITSESELQNIEVSNLKTGLYLLKLSNNDQSLTKKLMIN
ncbi:T9SS type A sorting domain-containing protein [Psychroflexus tropicus]|uniref:T9SS type A sorting domain-containing protein n=1 Tax=Psychroflexus tropicus TaxID=197345 RepID=UPI0003743AC7|nr:T9SS type A sorting domain-containing protein [Psychroflexus tropicus]